MKNITIGVDFLHSHPSYEMKHGVDKDHIIVDIEDWKRLLAFFIQDRSAMINLQAFLIGEESASTIIEKRYGVIGSTCSESKSNPTDKTSWSPISGQYIMGCDPVNGDSVALSFDVVVVDADLPDNKVMRMDHVNIYKRFFSDLSDIYKRNSIIKSAREDNGCV